MNPKRFLPHLILLISLLFSPGALTQQTAPIKSTDSAPLSIPFELVARHIVLKIQVNNSRPLSFIFDTGDKVGVIDIDRARELGLKLERQIRVGGAGAQTLTGATVQDARWSLLGLENFSQAISFAMPLENIAARFGHE